MYDKIHYKKKKKKHLSSAYLVTTGFGVQNSRIWTPTQTCASYVNLSKLILWAHFFMYQMQMVVWVCGGD